MEKYIFYILILLSFLISVLVAAILVVAFFYFRDRYKKARSQEESQVKKESPQAIYRPPRAEGYCANHSLEKAVALCAVCSKCLCDECSSGAENLYFCSDHFQTYIDHEWVTLTNIKTTPDNPTQGIALYQFRDDLWNKSEIPTFIVTHYRINIENDYIESYVQLHVRKEDQEVLSEKIKGHL